eukprot:TRINITY_DN4197_c0_g2_i3.p1 TRINITY_DN4197_c0_g2~~TRINITY_DN4197_c0_g2_i3.p1  ORF type:complete len:676 (-),score=132.95 TRINITY_DN4197_c0_g2_i3:240-2267(-)
MLCFLTSFFSALHDLQRSWDSLSRANFLYKEQAVIFLLKLSQGTWSEIDVSLIFDFLEKKDPTKLEYREFIQLFILSLEPFEHTSELDPSLSLIRKNHFSPYREVDVEVVLYDLLPTIGGLNNTTMSFANLGIFHTSILIYDTEISYCEGDGIHQTGPRASHVGKYRQNQYLGKTQVSPQELMTVLEEMREQWRGDNYNIRDQNCIHFCDVISVLLVYKHLPTTITRILELCKSLPVAIDACGFKSSHSDINTFGKRKRAGLTPYQSFDKFQDVSSLKTSSSLSSEPGDGDGGPEIDAFHELPDGSRMKQKGKIVLRDLVEEKRLNYERWVQRMEILDAENRKEAQKKKEDKMRKAQEEADSRAASNSNQSSDKNTSSLSNTEILVGTSGEAGVQPSVTLSHVDPLPDRVKQFTRLCKTEESSSTSGTTEFRSDNAGTITTATGTAEETRFPIITKIPITTIRSLQGNSSLVERGCTHLSDLEISLTRREFITPFSVPMITLAQSDLRSTSPTPSPRRYMAESSSGGSSERRMAESRTLSERKYPSPKLPKKNPGKTRNRGKSFNSKYHTEKKEKKRVHKSQDGSLTNLRQQHQIQNKIQIQTQTTSTQTLQQQESRTQTTYQIQTTSTTFTQNVYQPQLTEATSTTETTSASIPTDLDLIYTPPPPQLHKSTST